MSGVSSIVMVALLCGAETGPIYSVQVDMLHAYMMHHLHLLLGITWQDKVINREMRERTGLSSMSLIFNSMNI